MKLLRFAGDDRNPPEESIVLMKSSTRAWSCLPVLITAISLLGCQPSEPTAQGPSTEAPGSAGVEIVSGSAPEEAEKEKMLAAKEALFQSLSTRLMEAMAEGGPGAAIKVCQVEAGQLTSDVAQQEGLRIGRTGVRLRNPENTAPSWAQELVEAKTAEPHFVRLSSGDSAALLPIKLKAQCLMCHGPKEQILPDVQEQLAALYPNDAAIGFNEGDLRGWFWIELPADES